MPKPIVARINVTKILKQHLYDGKNGKYLNVAIFPNKNGKGQFGDTHFVTQEVSKEAREAGERGPIIGSLTMPDEAPAQTQPTSGGYRKASLPTQTQAADDWSDEPIPFARPHYLTVGGW